MGLRGFRFRFGQIGLDLNAWPLVQLYSPSDQGKAIISVIFSGVVLQFSERM